MNEKRPWPPAGPFNPASRVFNPLQTISPPRQKNVPVPNWKQHAFRPQWANGAGAVARTTSWSPPLFDLRPGIGKSQIGDVANAQEIWIPRGAMSMLRVQIVGLQLDAFSTNSIEVLAQNFVAVQNPANVVAVGPPENLSADFAGRPPSVLMSFLPPGSGYPPRFWRLQLTINYLRAHGVDPQFTIEATME